MSDSRKAPLLMPGPSSSRPGFRSCRARISPPICCCRELRHVFLSGVAAHTAKDGEPKLDVPDADIWQAAQVMIKRYSSL